MNWYEMAMIQVIQKKIAFNTTTQEVSVLCSLLVFEVMKNRNVY